MSRPRGGRSRGYLPAPRLQAGGVQGEQGLVPDGDVGLIGRLGNGALAQPLEQRRLVEQHLGPARAAPPP